MSKHSLRWAATLLAVCGVTAAWSGGTRQLATGGATQIEGSAGGGLAPWATIAGYTTEEEYGATAFGSFVDTGDYELQVVGVAAALRNRVELSLARQQLDLLTLGPALGLPGAQLEQDIIGIKVRLLGDVLYTSAPQVAVGAQFKHQRRFLIPGIVGAEDDRSVDWYLAATKVFLSGVADTNAFVNGTLRWTEANETGLLGFGGPDGGYRLEGEASAGLLFSRRLALGIEYRSKSSRLTGLPEDDWKDVFIGWFPNRHLAIVAAWVDLGTIATLDDQTGWYLSVQGAY